MDKRKTKIFLAAAILVFTMLACSFGAQPATEPPATSNLPVTVIVEPTSSIQQNNIPRTEAEVPRVELEQARAAIESGAAIAVDVRSAEAYAAGHIPGAIFIPLGEIETNPTGLDLDKDEWIITYCT